MKKFNTSAVCIPSIHYMVDLSGRLEQVRKMVDEGDFFTINRARQYGKTTLLYALKQNLQDAYYVVSLDFQQLGESKFRTEETFARAFASRFVRAMETDNTIEDQKLMGQLQVLKDLSLQGNRERPFELMELFDAISDICKAADRRIVLMIDEVDSASNNQVFLDFLAQIRSDYIRRMTQVTFQSVILAGVVDVKNLKRKFRSDDDRKVNSPWNIAADFLVDMSFHPTDIEGMLREYKAEHRFHFRNEETAELIYEYTDGYPYLVSRMCQIIDEQILGTKGFRDAEKAWGPAGVDEAARRLVREKNTLFESLTGKLINSAALRSMVQRILFNGAEVPYVAVNPDIEQASMYGFIREQDGKAVIANRIFETILYNLFLTTEEGQGTGIWQAGEIAKPQFIRDGRLDMDLILRRFTVTFDDLYGDRGEKFLEDDGRRYFLLYLKPIINGTGNYYIEARTRNNERTDVIVDYLGEQFVIELKIWRGNSYHERGERQLASYLDHYHLRKGWMISFCFNKNKQSGVHTIDLGGRTLVEAVV